MKRILILATAILLLCTSLFALSACGEEECAHNYSDSVTTEPSCEGEGVRTFKCTLCGDTYTEKIAALGHDYTSSVTAPTCTEKGYTTYICACGDTYTDDLVDAFGHTEVVDEQVNPTCTTPGFTKGSHCSVCEAAIIPRIEISALGHSYKSEVTEPNCTEQGYTVFTCYCGYEYAGDYVDALGHAPITDEAIAPSCTKTGLTEGSHCGVCGETIVKQEVVKANGHSYETITTAPTCTGMGYTTHTCHCGDTYKDSYISALGHSPVTDKAVAPDCTNIGLTEGAHCSTCGKVFVAQEVVPANGHSKITAIENEIVPDCLNGGYYESVVYCAACLVEFSRDSVVLDALGHSYVNHAAQEETCTEIGWDEYQTCRRCDYTTYEEIAAIGHDYIDHEAREATCLEIGWSAYQTCERCDYNSYVEISALGHNYIHIDAKEPNCGYVGWNEYDKCSRCSVSINYVELPQTTGFHDTQNGYCIGCGLPESSPGLLYELDGNNYYVIGIGSCTEKDIVIGIYNNRNVVAVMGDTDLCYSDIESLTFANCVTSIGGWAFYGCTALTSVTIPDSIMFIGDSAFGECTNLRSITVSPGNSNYKSIDGNLYSKDGKQLLQYAVAKTDTTFVIPGGVETIGSGAFKNCDSLVNITLPDGVTSIGYGAFIDCTNLRNITIPNGIKNIDTGAFYYCTSLNCSEYNNALYLGNQENPYLLLLKAKSTSITSCIIHEDTRIIHGSAFSSCENLKSVTIGKSVTSIGNSAFGYCGKLEEIIFNAIRLEGLYEYSDIFQYAGQNCSGIKVIVGKDVTKIPDFLFCAVESPFYASKIISIEFENGSACKSIGDFAFDNCNYLESITIPNSIESIGRFAFGNCSKLTTINYCGSEDEWNAVAKDATWNYNTGSYIINYNYVILPEAPVLIPDGAVDFDSVSALPVSNGVVEIKSESQVDASQYTDSYGNKQTVYAEDGVTPIPQWKGSITVTNGVLRIVDVSSISKSTNEATSAEIASTADLGQAILRFAPQKTVKTNTIVFQTRIKITSLSDGTKKYNAASSGIDFRMSYGTSRTQNFMWATLFVQNGKLALSDNSNTSNVLVSTADEGDFATLTFKYTYNETSDTATAEVIITDKFGIESKAEFIANVVKPSNFLRCSAVFNKPFQGIAEFDYIFVGSEPTYFGASHEHAYTDGKCECGEVDPDYTPEAPSGAITFNEDFEEIVEANIISIDTKDSEGNTFSIATVKDNKMLSMVKTDNTKQEIFHHVATDAAGSYDYVAYEAVLKYAPAKGQTNGDLEVAFLDASGEKILYTYLNYNGAGGALQIQAYKRVAAGTTGSGFATTSTPIKAGEFFKIRIEYILGKTENCTKIYINDELLIEGDYYSGTKGESGYTDTPYTAIDSAVILNYTKFVGTTFIDYSLLETRQTPENTISFD